MRKSVEKQVEQLIKRHGECLDDYRTLLLWYWTEVDKVFKYDLEKSMFYVNTWNIHLLTSPETITRTLRRLVTAKVNKIQEARIREADKDKNRQVKNE